VGHEVLQRGDQVPPVPEGSVALEPAHCRDAHSRYQVRVLTERLFHAAPARVARDVHHRRQRLVGATYPCLLRRHRVQRFDQLRVECRGQADRLREARGVDRRLPVQALLVEDDRNAEPALFQEESLDGIGELRLLTRTASLLRIVAAATHATPARIARATHLSQSVPLPERRSGFLQVEHAGRVDQRLRLLLPDSHHLCGLLLQRHPRQQVAHPLAGGEGRVLVGEVTASRGRIRRNGRLRAHRSWTWCACAARKKIHEMPQQRQRRQYCLGSPAGYRKAPRPVPQHPGSRQLCGVRSRIAAGRFQLRVPAAPVRRTGPRGSGCVSSNGYVPGRSLPIRVVCGRHPMTIRVCRASSNSTGVARRAGAPGWRGSGEEHASCRACHGAEISLSPCCPRSMSAHLRRRMSPTAADTVRIELPCR
jgi:hypothetical protein